MNRSMSRAAPIRFLIGILLLWTIGRSAMLMGWQPPAGSDDRQRNGKASGTTLHSAWQEARRAEDEPSPRISLIGTRAASERATTLKTSFLLRAQDIFGPNEPVPEPAHLISAARTMSASRAADGSGLTPAASIALAARHGHLSGSAWAFLRGGGRATALSPGGQIGGGQAGARFLYRLDGAGHVAASGRISTTLGGIRQSEAAIGLDWAPIAKLPVHLMLDRRIAIDKGGRNAWTVGMAGGIYALPIAKDWRLDGYGEAGIVGVQRRDLYADGAVRIARDIDLGNGRSLAIGGGLWGAAQPGTARMDVGPSAVLRLPVSGKTIAIALDWRERIGGRARPGSGAALTIATDL